MELLDVIRHPPQLDDQSIRKQTPLGELALHVPGGPGAVAASEQPEQARQADALARQGLERLNAGDSEGAERLLLEALTLQPFLPVAYGALHDICFDSGRYDQAEYYLKQLLVLEPTYVSLHRLAVCLARQRRYDEAAVIQHHLWVNRQSAPPAQAIEAAKAYLVTLHRQQAASRMVEVATQAAAEFGPDPAFTYQLLLGHLLQERWALVETELPRVLPTLTPEHPLRLKFLELLALVEQHQRQHQGAAALLGVRVESVPADQIRVVAQALVDHTDMGLVDAKTAIENLPAFVPAARLRASADVLVAALQRAGAVTILERTGRPHGITQPSGEAMPVDGGGGEH